MYTAEIVFSFSSIDLSVTENGPGEFMVALLFMSSIEVSVTLSTSDFDAIG